MTARDRIVLMVLVVIAALGAAWILVVSPERQQASKLATEVNTAKSELSSAEGKLDDARAAQQKYASAYSTVVNLGKAVPADEEVPSLVYQLSWASQQKSVGFESIVVAGSGGSASPTSSTSTPGAVPTAAAAGFSQMPFTFVFAGGFFELEKLFHRLSGFTTPTASGALQVSGRLLTIQSIKLEPEVGREPGKGTSVGSLRGTISATAYQLPAGESLTGGATAGSPTGSTQTVSSSAGGSSPTSPAIARVTP